MFTELTLKKVEATLENIKNGSSIEKACSNADLNRTSFYDWLRDTKENQDRYNKLIDSRTLIVEDALFQNALKGNITAQIFWLKNRAPDRWQDRVENKIIEEKVNVDDLKKEISELIKESGLGLLQTT
jgi:hypothetical protein